MGWIIGIVIAAAFVALALGLYLGQNRRSARGERDRVPPTGVPLDEADRRPDPGRERPAGESKNPA